MTKKLLRSPKAKPGELKAQWGRMAGDYPDLCYAWGDGCSRADGHLLHDVIASERYVYNSTDIEPSLIKELEARGYDITTLKFMIRKKEVKTP